MMAFTEPPLDPPWPKYTALRRTGKPGGHTNRARAHQTAAYLGLDVPCREAEAATKICCYHQVGIERVGPA